MSVCKLPSVDLLRKRLRYEPETGRLFWRECDAMSNRWNTKYAGKEAFFSLSRNGYKIGRLAGYQQILAHRVIWALCNGEWSNQQIDHINGDKIDNRIENLRSVTNQENGRNASRRSDNTSGVVGVGWFKRASCWRAQIRVNGKDIHLGSFQDFNAAVSARKKAEQYYGFHPNHGRSLTAKE